MNRRCFYWTGINVLVLASTIALLCYGNIIPFCQFSSPEEKKYLAITADGKAAIERCRKDTDENHSNHAPQIVLGHYVQCLVREIRATAYLIKTPTGEKRFKTALWKFDHAMGELINSIYCDDDFHCGSIISVYQGERSGQIYENLLDAMILERKASLDDETMLIKRTEWDKKHPDWLPEPLEPAE
ncbi:MAG: hypothetical protein HQL51_02005 [Magnetococcales bacterium]|nr:hypothetical protein [Magnetococcales bacterium]